MQVGPLTASSDWGVTDRSAAVPYWNEVPRVLTDVDLAGARNALLRIDELNGYHCGIEVRKQAVKLTF